MLEQRLGGLGACGNRSRSGHCGEDCQRLGCCGGRPAGDGAAARLEGAGVERRTADGRVFPAAAAARAGGALLGMRHRRPGARSRTAGAAAGRSGGKPGHPPIIVLRVGRARAASVEPGGVGSGRVGAGGRGPRSGGRRVDQPGCTTPIGTCASVSRPKIPAWRGLDGGGGANGLDGIPRPRLAGAPRLGPVGGAVGHHPGLQSPVGGPLHRMDRRQPALRSAPGALAGGLAALADRPAAQTAGGRAAAAGFRQRSACGVCRGDLPADLSRAMDRACQGGSCGRCPPC